MRVRYLQDPQTVYSYTTQTRVYPAAPVTSGPYSARYVPKYSNIIDEGGRRSWIATQGGARTLRYRVCEHVRWSVELQKTAAGPIYFGPQNWFTHNMAELLRWFGTGTPMAADLAPWLATFTRGLLPDCYSGHYDRWESRAKPTMRSRANMSVFLYELRDFKRMFDLLPEKHFKFSDWKGVLKYANGQHLNYNFGWKPFLKDLKHIFRELSTFEGRLAKFVMNAGKDLTRHVQDDVSVSTQTVSDIPTSNTDWRWKYTLTTQSQGFSTFQMSYGMPDYSPAELHWRALFDALGLHADPANIWAILPWSFVVDWFANLTPVFAQFNSSDWVQPWINLVQACSSIKASATFQTWVKYWNYPGQTYYPAGTCTYSLYQRNTGAPNFAWEPGTLTADRVRLLASLGAGRFH